MRNSKVKKIRKNLQEAGYSTKAKTYKRTATGAIEADIDRQQYRNLKRKLSHS